MPRTRFNLSVPLLALVLAASFALPAAAIRVPPPPDYGDRRDPDLPGGERYGEDETFEGYPVDPGRPGDAYYDASTEFRRHSPNYAGASTGFGLMGGLGRLYGRVFDEHVSGPVVGAFLSNTTGLGAATITGAITRSWFNSSIEGAEVDVTRWDFHGSLSIHPGFFFGFGGTRLDYTIANFYVMAGGQMTLQTTRGADIDSRFFRPGFHMGLGIDTYLDDIHDGKAFWIGVQYRWNNTAGGRNDDLFRYNWTREHQVLLRLTFRINGPGF